MVEIILEMERHSVWGIQIGYLEEIEKVLSLSIPLFLSLFIPLFLSLSIPLFLSLSIPLFISLSIFLLQAGLVLSFLRTFKFNSYNFTEIHVELKF